MSKYFLTLIAFVSIVSAASCQNKASNEDKTALNPTEFETKIAKASNAVVLDVCTPNEFKQQHLENAVNVNYHADGFSAQLEQMDKNKPYFVYCWAGSRSAKAAKVMRGMGFAKVYELEGGISNWMRKDKPVVTE